ncbi:hypothetical protein K1719_042445 [Acacia pycnantha]|nr:hypothetical protein K1719_042445 [Acacia pycnantha]
MILTCAYVVLKWIDVEFCDFIITVLWQLVGWPTFLVNFILWLLLAGLITTLLRLTDGLHSSLWCRGKAC